MIKKLVLNDGTRERELHLVGTIVVGRDPSCEISRDDSLLSRRHAEFVTAGNVVTVKDLGSRNGVFVNGARASEQALEPGDVVQIGPLRARFVLDASPPSISPEAMDIDRTAVIRKAVVVPSPAVPVAAAVHPAVALAFEEVDEDATRLVPSRAAESASESSPLFMRPQEAEADEGDDEDDVDVTHFTAAPQIQAAPTVLRKVEPPQPNPPSNALDAFIYGQLTALALAILSTATIAVLMWTRSVGGDSAGQSSSLAWFALPAVAAAGGIVVIGAAVNRRITRALTETERGRAYQAGQKTSA